MGKYNNTGDENQRGYTQLIHRVIHSVVKV